MGKSEAHRLHDAEVAAEAIHGGLRRRAQPLLGTLVEVALHCGSAAAFVQASDVAFQALREVHHAMSFHDPHSDVRRIGQAAAGEVLTVNPHTWNVLYLARRIEADSGGLFNAAVAPALVQRGLLPSPDGAQVPVASGLVDGLALLSEHRVRVLQPLWLDLGGIAKGYAVDCAVEALQRLGTSDGRVHSGSMPPGLINAGGDMRAFGRLRHPVHLRFSDGLMHVATLQNGALAASSNAALSPDDTPHIDPRNQRSACSAFTVVVQAQSAAVADALTKVALLCPATADRLCAASPGELQTGWQAQWRAFHQVPEHAAKRVH